MDSDIVILDRPIDRALLKRLVGAHFEDMAKFVADIERGVIAIGGELHADAEAMLLVNGSRQPVYSLVGLGEPLP